MNGPYGEIMRGARLQPVNIRRRHVSYFSSGSFGFSFDVAVCPEAVAIDASETSKIDRLLADIVEDLIEGWKCEAVEPASDFCQSDRRAGGFPNPEQQSCRQIFSLIFGNNIET